MSEAMRSATLADLLAFGDGVKAEILDGVVQIQAMPRFVHGTAISEVSADLTPNYGPRRRGPGGWWIATDVSVRLSPDDLVRPDVVGWRRDRVPRAPTDDPVEVRPDWVCEVLSPANRRTDLVTKRRIYERAGVPWYWQLDPDMQTVTVLEWTDQGYVVRMVLMDDDEEPIPPFLEAPLAVRNWFPCRENDDPAP